MKTESKWEKDGLVIINEGVNTSATINVYLGSGEDFREVIKEVCKEVLKEERRRTAFETAYGRRSDG